MNVHHRHILSLVIQSDLAYVTTAHSCPIYVGDPINILSILSDYHVDEVLIVLQGYRSNPERIPNIVRSLRLTADFPLSFTGCIDTQLDIDNFFHSGADRLFFPAKRTLSNTRLIEYATHRYGQQAVGLSVDYYKFGSRRIVPLLEPTRNVELHAFTDLFNSSLISDILLTSVLHSGTEQGIDFKVLDESCLSNCPNPLLLSGGLGYFLNETMSLCAEHHPLFSGIASSTSAFFLNDHSSVLVSLPFLSNRYQ